jgi:hypothetical protein
MLYQVLQSIFVWDGKQETMEKCLPANEDGLFTVHMAIVTANIGKRVFVEQVTVPVLLQTTQEQKQMTQPMQGCLLGYMLTNLGHATLAGRTDEECNTEIFSIKDWAACMTATCPKPL